MHQCVERSLPRAVSALLSHGSDVNCKNKQGLSPLHVALETRSGAHPFTSDEIVHCLVKNGYNTDINLPDAHGILRYFQSSFPTTLVVLVEQAIQCVCVCLSVFGQ